MEKKKKEGEREKMNRLDVSLDAVRTVNHVAVDVSLKIFHGLQLFVHGVFFGTCENDEGAQNQRCGHNTAVTKQFALAHSSFLLCFRGCRGPA